MKKTLIAIGVFAAFASNVHAQSSVQISGVADAYIGSLRNAGDKGRRSVVNSGGLTTSWFGFKGSEDLGGGLKANFALTSYIQVDSGTQGRFPNDPLFSRDANVGLSGDFGAVTVGRSLAPNFLPTILFNPLGNSFTFSPLVLHMNVPLFNGTGWAKTTPADTGWSNQVTYSSPKMGGLSANLHYQLGEQASNSPNKGARNVGFNALYFNGPLALTAFYERAQVENPGTNLPFTVKVAGVTPDPLQTKQSWMLGGSYDAGAVKGFATYGQSKSDVVVVKAKTYSLGAAIPMGGGKLLAALAETKVEAGNTRQTVTMGYDYNLSKRTDVYAMLMNDRITTFSSGTSFGLGIRHSF